MFFLLNWHFTFVTTRVFAAMKWKQLLARFFSGALVALPSWNKFTPNCNRCIDSNCNANSKSNSQTINAINSSIVSNVDRNSKSNNKNNRNVNSRCCNNVAIVVVATIVALTWMVMAIVRASSPTGTATTACPLLSTTASFPPVTTMLIA